ncbi:37S ribosomal protein S16, mitochondrial [Vermiconidia calcicola]|uniref:37S ribosomal protein S16, mitochondrial n=1 Tax=Vermiconidia calcicola TaxID=1690605 RepID=A0ACC3NKB5_9PEZI|nr:37S ribosomal protein S16, mitochondrial [Vermiconidia calcicola]
MVLKLRLARIKTPGGARRHHPRYNIVLAHARTARDSKPLEVLGTYNPIPELPLGTSESEAQGRSGDRGAEGKVRKVKDIKVDVARAKYWIGVGAQPSDTVWRLLSMIGLLPPKYLPTGEQTTNALKTVRFPTHDMSGVEARQVGMSKGPVMRALEEKGAREV